jgi:hypothetical protein
MMKYGFAHAPVNPTQHVSFIVRVRDELTPPEKLVWDVTAAWCVLRWVPLTPQSISPAGGR